LKTRGRDKSHALHRTDNKLRYSRPASDFKRIVSKIDQYNADLASVVGVDGPWTIQDRYSKL